MSLSSQSFTCPPHHDATHPPSMIGRGEGRCLGARGVSVAGRGFLPTEMAVVTATRTAAAVGPGPACTMWAQTVM